MYGNVFCVWLWQTTLPALTLGNVDVELGAEVDLVVGPVLVQAGTHPDPVQYGHLHSREQL